MPCPVLELPIAGSIFRQQFAMTEAVLDCKPDIAVDIGFVGEATPTAQETESTVDDTTVSKARTIEIPSSVQSFLKIRHMHNGSDLQIICRKFSSGDHHERVTFYVHREVLMQKCAFFADRQNFVVVSGNVSQRSYQNVHQPAAFEEITEYDDDMVYEVLRFVYTGMLCPPYGFSRRALQLLKLIDYLGVFDMAERNSELPNIVRDPVITNLLRSMYIEGVDSADRIRTVEELCKGNLLGFQLKRALAIRLLEVQPGFVTPALQQELIDGGLLDSSSFSLPETTDRSVPADDDLEVTVEEDEKDDVAMVDVDVVFRPAKRLCMTEQRQRPFPLLRTVQPDVAAHHRGQFPVAPPPQHIPTPQRSQNHRRITACAGC